MDNTRSAYANGNIYPSRCVKPDTSTPQNFRVIMATDGSDSHGDKCIGISQKGQWRDPSNADGYATIAAANGGPPVMIYQDGAKDVAAEAGGNIAYGDYLKSDSVGRVISVTADGDYIVGQSRMAGVVGDLIDMDVMIGQQAS